MSGAYTHISVVNDARAAAKTAGLRKSTLKAIGLHLNFVELGSVSPDYPYLAFERDQTAWADAMHYTSTAAFVRAVVKLVSSSEPEVQPKLTAWLMGLAAHIATDMTIHPVVERKVGPYKGNEAAHRQCEMHQDAYIFPKVVGVGPTNLSEHMASGIGKCFDASDEERLDADISHIWSTALTQTYPALAAQTPAEPDSWQQGFKKVLLTLAKVNQLLPFARHVGTGLGLTYPAQTSVDPQFIEDLVTPEGKKHFDEIYQRALSNVLAVWKGLDDALSNGGSSELDRLEDWNLDTGRSIPTGKLVFWEN